MNVGGAISKNSKKLSLYISITKLIMITTSSQKLLKTRNYFKNLQNREISWQNRRSGD